jgi:PH-interacting protein
MQLRFFAYYFYAAYICRYPHIGKDHLVKLLKQLMVSSCHPGSLIGDVSPNAADAPTLLGSNSFSLLACMYIMFF